jgi:ketosteroid isomerase-like protein
LDLEARLQRVEAELEIRNLISRYCFTIDGRDLAGVASLFCEDAVVRSADGVMNASGVDAIIDQYRQRFEVLGVSNHVTHDIALELIPGLPSEASGLVSSHAELWRKNRMMVTALRYVDKYRKTERGWLFAERVLSFLYYIPVTDYGTILGEPDRQRAYDHPVPADYPERLSTWIAYARGTAAG